MSEGIETQNAIHINYISKDIRYLLQRIENIEKKLGIEYEKEVLDRLEKMTEEIIDEKNNS